MNRGWNGFCLILERPPGFGARNPRSEAYVRDHKHRGQSVALDQGWNGFGLILERLFWLRSVKPQVRGMIRACGCVWSDQSLDRRAA